MDIQNKKGLVSIIICLYNVSSYLREKKLSCIFQQTYQNLEIILVDDGSTDDTYTLCEELKDSDDRIILIRKRNGGLGSARNVGLDHAQGEYIWFYDVDDEADSQLVEKNVEWMETFGSDMNIFGYHCITPALHLSEEVHFKERIIHDNKTLKSIFVDELLFVPNGNGFAWNKFYRSSFIEKYGFRFGNQRIQQDEGFNLQFYPLLNNVYISSELLYSYYIYNSGNNRSRYISNRVDIYISIYNHFQSFITQWSLDDKRLEKYVYDRLYSGIEISILFNAFHRDSNCSREERKREIYGILNNQQIKNCIQYIYDRNELNLERTFYLHAFMHCSYNEIIFLKKIFQILRMIKRCMH